MHTYIHTLDVEEASKCTSLRKQTKAKNDHCAVGFIIGETGVAAKKMGAEVGGKKGRVGVGAISIAGGRNAATGPCINIDKRGKEKGAGVREGGTHFIECLYGPPVTRQVHTHIHSRKSCK